VPAHFSFVAKRAYGFRTSGALEVVGAFWAVKEQTLLWFFVLASIAVAYKGLSDLYEQTREIVERIEQLEQREEAE